MSNQERLLGKESDNEPLARVFYGEGDTPELWQHVGMRLPDANIIAGAERGYGNLRPVLENGVTVILQQGNKNALVLRGAVEEEDHFSLSSVAHEASEKRGRIPEPPHVAGIAWNEDIQQKAREDWQNAYDTLVQRSPYVREAIKNTGAWLVIDAKEDLKGFSIAQNEWRKDVLDGRLSNLDDQFGQEVKQLERKYEDGWKGVGKVEGELPAHSLASRALTGVALAASLPFNPALHMQDVPALIQPADANIMIIISQNQGVENAALAGNSNPSRENRAISRGINSALDFYDNYVDKLIPDTSEGQINKAKEVLGIDNSENIEGGFSTLAKYAYDDVLARGGTEEDAIFAVKAAGMGFFQSPDGSKWYHVYGREEAKLEEVTRDQVQKNTTVKAIAAALAEAYKSGGWGSNEPVGGNPVPTQEKNVPSTPVVPNTPEAQSVELSGNINIGNQESENNFLLQHPEFNADETTPISVEISGKVFNLMEAQKGNYYIEINGVWKNLVAVDQKIGNEDYVVLQYLPRIPNPGESVQMESILWYPSFTEDQWKAMTPEQKNMAWIHFAPPSELENEIPGYQRETGQGIPLNISPNEDFPSFLVSLQLKNTSFTEPEKDATQIPPSEVITPTPPLPTEANTPTPEVKQYAVCGAEQWKNCYIPIGELGPNGDYKKWLDQNWNPNLPTPVSGDTSRYRVIWDGTGSAAYIMNPDVTNEKPWAVGFTYGYTKCGVTWGGTSHEMNCAVVPVAIAVPDHPGETKKVIGLIVQAYDAPDAAMVKDFKQIEKQDILMLNGFKFDPATGKASIAGNDTLDILGQIIANYPDLHERFKKYSEQLDPTSIDGFVIGISALYKR